MSSHTRRPEQVYLFQVHLNGPNQIRLCPCRSTCLLACLAWPIKQCALFVCVCEPLGQVDVAEHTKARNKGHVRSPSGLRGRPIERSLIDHLLFYVNDDDLWLIFANVVCVCVYLARVSRPTRQPAFQGDWTLCAAPTRRRAANMNLTGSIAPKNHQSMAVSVPTRPEAAAWTPGRPRRNEPKLSAACGRPLMDTGGPSGAT